MPGPDGPWLMVDASCTRNTSSQQSVQQSLFQGAHVWLDSELVAIVVDEANDRFDGRSSSAAKKADALFRISLALFASANSARNRRFSASRSTDSAGVALPESLCLRNPDSQGLFTQAEFVRDTGDRSVRGVGVGLGMDDELDGTSLEFVGVFHWQERISFFQSPCRYYPRGDSPRGEERIHDAIDVLPG